MQRVATTARAGHGIVWRVRRKPAVPAFPELLVGPCQIRHCVGTVHHETQDSGVHQLRQLGEFRGLVSGYDGPNPAADPAPVADAAERGQRAKRQRAGLRGRDDSLREGANPFGTDGQVLHRGAAPAQRLHVQHLPDPAAGLEPRNPGFPGDFEDVEADLFRETNAVYSQLYIRSMALTPLETVSTITSPGFGFRMASSSASRTEGSP